MPSKLTLSLDEEVIRRAKRYARKRKTSVSRVVERYLDIVSRPVEDSAAPPFLRKLRGSLSSAQLSDYRRYLSRKHR